jgi:hypothetical protein
MTSDEQAKAKEEKPPERTPYVRAVDGSPPLEFWVDTPDGSIFVRAKRLGVYEWRALDDHLIGEIKDGADPTGTERRRTDVIRLSKVVLSVEHPEWQGDAAKFFNLPGNDRLAAFTWDRFYQETMGAFAAPRMKCGDAATGNVASEGGLARGAAGTPDA